MPTHPQTQGNRRRVFELCTRLKAAGYAVHYIWHAAEWGGAIGAAHFAAMQQAWDQLHVVPAGSKDASYRPTGKDATVDQAWPGGLEDMIEWCRQNNDYQLVIASYATYTKALTLFEGTAAVRLLDTHDVLSGRHELLAQAGAEQEFHSLPRDEEAKAALRADIVLAIQAFEAAHFEALGASEVQVLGYAGTAHAPVEAPSRPVAGIIGSFNNVIIENTRTFVEALAAREDALPADFELLLAGAMCDGLTEPMPPFVRMLGRIPDIESFYRQLSLALVPIDFGTGLKIKTIEALSYGLPVLGTEHAFLGLESDCQEHRFEDAAALAAALPPTIGDPAALGRLAKVSERLFHENEARVADQTKALLARIDAIHAERENAAPPFDTGQLRRHDYVYLFGAGVGCRMILNAAEAPDRARVKAVLDSYKSGQFVEGLSVGPWTDVAEADRAAATVVITITAPEWRTVADELKEAGFGTILYAGDWVRQQLV